MKIFQCEQMTPPWFELHRGRPTASKFDRIITPKTGKLASAHDEYINELIAQRLYSGPITDLDNYPPNKAMLHGIATEPEARRWLEAERSYEAQTIGFATTDDGRFGCSPDGCVGLEQDVGLAWVKGIIELKCPTQKTQVGYLRAKTLPDEYRAQVHGQLIVTGAEYADFLSYCPGFPPLLIRVEPNDFTKKLRAVLEEFYAAYAQAAKEMGVSL